MSETEDTRDDYGTTETADGRKPPRGFNKGLMKAAGLFKMAFIRERSQQSAMTAEDVEWAIEYDRTHRTPLEGCQERPCMLCRIIGHKWTDKRWTVSNSVQVQEREIFSNCIRCGKESGLFPLGSMSYDFERECEEAGQ
ncbi:hypothetical protein M0R72_21455 [Candidatus Pacearchaeota archaeon]|jgi:hypothetical protein|nr:hypothetical protein [Candidatus Pacearchaeota archaeon]